jgi:DNA-binding winged helix-turn-helix (wHTH) protein
MTDKTVYEFGDFRLDPFRRTLYLIDEPRSLTPTAFALLLVFVQNHGQTLTRTDLIKRVWADAIVTDNNFNVTLNAVRRALDESAKQPRYISKLPGGYRFIADVREIGSETNSVDPRVVGEEVSEQHTTGVPKDASSIHLPHVLLSCCLYAALYATSLFLEVAYEINRFEGMAWSTAPLIFAWITISSIVGLMADRKLTSKGKTGGLALSVATFFIAAALLFLVLKRFLPPFPVTQSSLQSYPAQAAYLKDVSYFLALAFCFLIVPFHFIATVDHAIQRGHHNQIFGLLAGNKLSASPTGTIYPRFWALASLLLVFAAFSLVMTARLLDNLKPGPYTNLFTQLVYLRGILYFGLGLECLLWYYQALSSAKSRCLFLAHR